MKKYICDMLGCNENAVRDNITICDGYTTVIGDTTYKPFERSSIKRVDLCREHFKEWCKLTYSMYDPLYDLVEDGVK